MSTELVAIERINIKKDNGDADALRSCLAHYLQQFLDSASIESMTLHELTIRIGGEPVLNVSDKTGGVGLSGLDKDWQHTETVHKAIEQIILDADVEVFLSYDMIHYFSNKNFYGSAFWTDMLQEFGCEAVRYHGLEYYDVESNVVMLYFDGKQLCDNPDYVPEEEVKDIDAWFCYTFDMELDAGDTFTVKQVDKMQETIVSTVNKVVHDNERLILRLDSLAYALNQRSAQNPWDTDVVFAMTKLDTVISKTEEDIKQDEEISKEAMKRYDTLNGGN